MYDINDATFFVFQESMKVLACTIFQLDSLFIDFYEMKLSCELSLFEWFNEI